MRTEILVINQRADTFPSVFLGNRLGTLCGAFLPGGDWLLKGGKPKFEEKGETFQKIGGKESIKLLDQEKVTCK